MHLLDLPLEVLIEIMGYLSYDEIAKKRIVSRRFNEICKQMLNSGYNKVTRQQSELHRRIRNMLPRRESERRRHVLARHAEILNSLETRVSMLSLTYNKYIERNFCCFIPGKVLDEILRVMNLISKSQDQQLNPHQVLQEVRDLSSMAIEHFDDNFAGEYSAIIMARPNTRTQNSANAEQQQHEALPANNLGDITFSGMNSNPLNEHSYSSTQPATPNGTPAYVGAPAAAAPGASSFYQYQYQQQHQQPGPFWPAAPNYNVSSYYVQTQSNEYLIRQRINYLLYLPPGELLRQLNALPLPELNSNYYNQFDTNRGATIEELNNLSLYCSNTQLKVADAIVSMNMVLRQLQKDLIKQNGKIAILEKRIAEFEELRLNMQQQIEITNNVEQRIENLKSNVEQINTNVEEKIVNLTSNVEGKIVNLTSNVEQINTNVEQINTNVEEKIVNLTSNVEGKIVNLTSDVKQINTNVEQINTNVAQINTNVEEKIVNLASNVEQINTNVEQKFGEIDQVSATIDEVRNELNCNILQIKEEIRTKQHFPYVERPEECQASSACCAKCCSFQTKPSPVSSDKNQTKQHELPTSSNAMLPKHYLVGMANQPHVAHSHACKRPHDDDANEHGVTAGHADVNAKKIRTNFAPNGLN